MWEEAKIDTFSFVKRQFVDCAPGSNSIKIRLESDWVQSGGNTTETFCGISKHYSN